MPVDRPDFSPEPWPRLLSDFAPLAGRIKARPEDFEVEEVPLYAASGEGTHTYFFIEKRDLSTYDAMQKLAAGLGVDRREFGYAGLKDAVAVARQWLSIEHVDPQRVRELTWPNLRILQVTRHVNKIKLGHLRGNRFCLRVRDFDAGRFDELQRAFQRLLQKGVPNYFGPQRFGVRGDGWLIGRAIVRGDLPAALDQMLGKPSVRDRGGLLRAREAYDAGDFDLAMRHWPPSFREERRAVAALRRGANKKRAFLTLNPGLRSFFVAAYQSLLFNRVLAARLGQGLDRLLPGDLAWRHANGAVFLVGDAAAEQARADAFEISPSGPLFGYRMSEPEGESGRVEADVLAAEGLSAESFRAPKLRVKGARRPLRFPLEEGRVRLGADEHGPYLELNFVLPRGCYATTVLRELVLDGETEREPDGE
jgi:tRNA pseudouridine13 synthase